MALSGGISADLRLALTHSLPVLHACRPHTCELSITQPPACFLECRLYIPDDTEYIEQDLEQLKVLFEADGQGLPAKDIDELCAPVLDLLNVLQLETGILIKNFKDVRHNLLLAVPCCKTQAFCVLAKTAAWLWNQVLARLVVVPSSLLCTWRQLHACQSVVYNMLFTPLLFKLAAQCLAAQCSIDVSLLKMMPHCPEVLWLDCREACYAVCPPQQ